MKTSGMWNAGAGKGHGGPNVDMGYFRLSSQGRPYGGSLHQKEQAMRKAEEKHSPAGGNRKWLQGDEREVPGDEVGAQARVVMLGLGKVFEYLLL